MYFGGGTAVEMNHAKINLSPTHAKKKKYVEAMQNVLHLDKDHDDIIAYLIYLKEK
jgi:hypothetical protein